MNPGSYSFRGLAVGGENQPSNLPRNAMMCTQVSTDLLRSQGYKVRAFSMNNMTVQNIGTVSCIHDSTNSSYFESLSVGSVTMICAIQCVCYYMYQ